MLAHALYHSDIAQPVQLKPDLNKIAEKPLSERRSALFSHNIMANKKRTSVRLETEVWQALCEISQREKVSMHELCTVISQRKSRNSSLTAAIRVFVLTYFRAAATEEGHRQARHGETLRDIISELANPSDCSDIKKDRQESDIYQSCNLEHSLANNDTNVKYTMST